MVLFVILQFKYMKWQKFYQQRKRDFFPGHVTQYYFQSNRHYRNKRTTNNL